MARTRAHAHKPVAFAGAACSSKMLRAICSNAQRGSASDGTQNVSPKEGGCGTAGMRRVRPFGQWAEVGGCVRPHLYGCGTVAAAHRTRLKLSSSGILLAAFLAAGREHGFAVLDQLRHRDRVHAIKPSAESKVHAAAREPVDAPMLVEHEFHGFSVHVFGGRRDFLY